MSVLKKSFKSLRLNSNNQKFISAKPLTATRGENYKRVLIALKSAHINCQKSYKNTRFRWNKSVAILALT